MLRLYYVHANGRQAHVMAVGLESAAEIGRHVLGAERVVVMPVRNRETKTLCYERKP